MTQHDIVLAHIRRNGSISSYEAIMDHGIARLAARIHDLTRDRGIQFRKENRVNPVTKKRYTRYYLMEEEPA